MSLPLTSLVPTIVEITDFIETNWPHIWWFPNWYLGVPLRFVTGPIVPLLTIMLGKISGLSIETSYILLIGSLWTLGSIGVKKLVYELGAGKWVGWSASVFFLLLPGHIWLFSYGNGLNHIVISLLPWASLVWLRAQQSWKAGWVFATISLLSIVLLIDVGSLLALLVLAAVLILIQEKSRWLDSGIKSILLLLTAIFVATVWYTPRFWWTLLGNPSFAGKPLSQVIPFIIQLLEALIPLVLGAWFVQTRYRFRYRLIRFGVLFGASFLFLTVIRFLSDVDFWMDWTSYFLELQFALALVLSVLVNRVIQRYKTIQIVVFLIISILTIIDGGLVYWLYKADEKIVAYRNDVQNLVGNTGENERLFLSGSPVFWLGGILQVRGGRDEASTHPFWARGAYVVREGEREEELAAWFKALGISYVLVHSEGSREYFRDFKNTERFAGFPLIVQNSGDSFYDTGGDIARFASVELRTLDFRRFAKEGELLARYAELLEEPMLFWYDRPDLIRLDPLEKKLDRDRLISLAVTYDRNWRATTGKLQKDVLGNMLVLPDTQVAEIVLEYNEPLMSWGWGSAATIISLWLLLNADKLGSVLSRKLSTFSGLSGGAGENEEESY